MSITRERDPREKVFHIPAPRAPLRLFLRRLASGGGARPVLYVHGATFPSGLSVAHRFDGRSWRDALVAAGYDVWGLDFLGFGESDRYPEMDAPADANPPLCDARDAAAQIAVAVRFIVAQTGAPRVSLVAHSWGSMAAGRFAGEHPDRVERLVLFAPIARREGPPCSAPEPAWRSVGLEDQWARFTEDVPPGEPPVLSSSHFEDWGQAYLDSDPGSRGRNPVGARIPAGPTVDNLRAFAGELPWDPALVEAPVAIIRGAWDHLVTDADARWLLDALVRSPAKRDVTIARGTHLMHLEVMRTALWRETIAFLGGGDGAPAPN